MPPTFTIPLLFAVLACACASAGCSSFSGGSTASCTDASVSFQSDVMPVFAANCTSTGACHGQPNNSGEENLYLGLSASEGTNGPADVATVYAGFVGVKSVEDPSMNLVTAGDLANSFLWHKVDGDQDSDSTVASGCAPVAAGQSACVDCVTGAPCGVQMPFASTIDPSSICILQNWIVQGAQDN